MPVMNQQQPDRKHASPEHRAPRRVVITGMGAVTPFGLGVTTFAEALRAGKSGIRLLQQLDTSQLPTKGGGEVTCDLPAIPGLPANLPRFIHFAALAFQEAWEMAGLAWHATSSLGTNPFSEKRVSVTSPAAADVSALTNLRWGVLLGTSRGIVRELELAATKLRELGPARLQAEHPDLLAALFPAFGASPLGRAIANLIGAGGPVATLSAACASGTISIGEAAQWIREGRCDLVVAGGAEAPFTPVSFAGVCSSKAMSERWDDPAAACRPFDAERDGYVMGEGAGVLILEAEETARERGATILAEVIGYAQTDDASHITVPTGEGLKTAITLALRAAGVTPEALDYINAHGTSTKLNDRWETRALREALGPHAARIPVSSTKSMTGHLLGAAGAIEAIACLVAMEQHFLPPTINLHRQDPDCDLDFVPNEARPAAVRTAMTQSLGFGGHNAALIIRHFSKTYQQD